MNSLPAILVTAALTASAALAAEAPSLAKVYDSQLANAEREIVPLAEAMPADKYDFAPTNGEFAGVRTFRQQVTHIATVIYRLAAASEQVASPVDAGKEENGPANITTKEQAVQFLKDAFTYGHKAMLALTPENQTAMLKNPFRPGAEVPRGSIILTMLTHNWDHYGQMVEYARMNGIVPPASRPRPAAAKKKK